MSRLLPILLSLFCGLCALASCSDDLLTDAASQPVYVLNDSDSYNLGILLAGHTTATQKLMLYNFNEGEIALESIRLRGADSSIFRINVDGMAGTDFTNPDFLHIAKGDSLFVLVEATFKGQQSERDVVREDWLDIQCNGRLQSIRLRVTTRSVEEFRSDTLRSDTLWATDGLNKLIYGDLVITEGVTLTIAPGVTLYLHDHASLQVYGTLRIEGTLQQPVSLMGDRTDRIFDNLYYRDMSAQWDGIRFHPGSKDNLLQYAEIKGMTYGIQLRQDSVSTAPLAPVSPSPVAPQEDPKRYAYGPDFMDDADQQLIIRNSLILNSDSSLISAYNSNMIVENTCLMNSAGALLELAGGAYDITHCTLANYNYWAAFSRCDVVLRNYVETEDGARYHCPLYRANFTNSIIFGQNGRDPNVDANGYTQFVDEGGQLIDSLFFYRFDHCLLHSTSGYDDEDCLSTLWSEDPLYQLVDMPNYTVDPHLLPESPCIGHGEPRTVSRLPLDRDGLPRASTPALGCYEPQP